MFHNNSLSEISHNKGCVAVFFVRRFINHISGSEQGQ